MDLRKYSLECDICDIRELASSEYILFHNWLNRVH